MFKAIYVDFDGCLSDEDPGAILELEMIKFVREINFRSKKEPDVPFVAINSGRPEAYIEAHAQTLGINQYCIFESGAGIFRYITPTIELYLDKKIPNTITTDFLEITHTVSKIYGISRQPNKEYSMSFIFQKNDPRISEIADFIKSYIQDKNLPYYVDIGINFININVKQVNKGTGLLMAAEKLKIKANEIVGIGDSNGDWDFMKLCGFSACPQNGTHNLKEKCDYVSPFTSWRGTIDIIQKIFDNNK